VVNPARHRFARDLYMAAWRLARNRRREIACMNYSSNGKTDQLYQSFACCRRFISGISC